MTNRSEMKAVLLTVGSLAMTAGVIANAYLQKKQFYPSVVYITKSSPSKAVLYLQAFVFVVLMGKMMRKLFFGQLRAAEMEHLIERSWYAVTETCLAFTVFRDDFSPRFVALFTLLLFLKCFHWLAEDRVDYMERSPVISFIFHLRVLCLLLVLGAVDAYFIQHAYHSTLIKGASVQLVFGFEYAILLTVVMHIFVKYILHSIDLQSENPWENKAVYLLYAELVLGFFKVILYMMFLAIMIKVHTFPLFAIRPMYLTMRAFKKALNDVIMSRRAIRNMNTLYPDATPEELQSGDNVCIICREEMATACKKLPCNHIFHTSCLRSWFQRQQTCPTCRMDILRPPAPRATPQPAPGPPQAAVQPPQPPAFPNFPNIPGFPAWPPQQPQAPPPATPPASSAGSTEASSTPGVAPAPAQSPTPGAMPAMPGMMPPFMMPPFMMGMGMPFGLLPPMPPPNFAGLSEEELRVMEGSERAAIEARVQCLRNIQVLLDAAMVQIQQYSSVAANAGYPPMAMPSSSSHSQGPSATKTQSTSAEGTTSNHITTAVTSTTSILTSPKASPAEADSSKNTADSTTDASSVEGAVGYSPPKEEFIPEWTDPREEESGDHELNEIRRRRVQRFSSNNLEAMDKQGETSTE